MKMLTADEAMIRRVLPPRRQDTHKGDYGRAFLLCGATGFTGAAYFAAESAVRSGAGLVDLAVPSAIYPIAAAKLNEAMVHPAACLEDGTVAAAALDELRGRAERADALLIGCGLGRGREVEPVVLSMLAAAKAPVVLDADGINALCAHKDKIAAAQAEVILTPHDGELTRLLGEAPVRAGEERTAAAVRIARTLGATLVMKGHVTVTADKAGRVCVNTTGNAGMARGGSGDVLAGIIVALAAQGIPPFEAAAAGAYIHGVAGDVARAVQGEIGMTPTDMLRLLPRAFYRCRGG